MAYSKMAINEKTIRNSCNFVKDVDVLIGAVERLIVRLLLFGIFLYGVVQVIRHL